MTCKTNRWHPASTWIVLFPDLEPPGQDPVRDEIIEVAMAPFTYGLAGEICEIGEAFNRLRQPSRATPAEVTAQGRSVAKAELAAIAVGHEAANEQVAIVSLSIGPKLRARAE